jgi:hypothetical protein
MSVVLNSMMLDNPYTIADYNRKLKAKTGFLMGIKNASTELQQHMKNYFSIFFSKIPLLKGAPYSPLYSATDTTREFIKQRDENLKSLDPRQYEVHKLEPRMGIVVRSLENGIILPGTKHLIGGYESEGGSLSRPNEMC